MPPRWVCEVLCNCETRNGFVITPVIFVHLTTILCECSITEGAVLMHLRQLWAGTIRRGTFPNKMALMRDIDSRNVPREGPFPSQCPSRGPFGIEMSLAGDGPNWRSFERVSENLLKSSVIMRHECHRIEILCILRTAACVQDSPKERRACGNVTPQEQDEALW